MSQPQDPTTQPASPPAGPFASVVGTVIGGILGLLVLVLVVSLLERPATGPIQELPHVAVLVEVEAGVLADSNGRAQLAALQRGLEEAGLSVHGPLSSPILVPAATRGGAPVARRVDALSDEELAGATPYLGSGGWLIPRIYSPDLRQALFRVAPPGRGSFPPGTIAALEKATQAFQGQVPGAQVWLYSRALGLEDDEARNRINVTFGVQTALVNLRSQDRKLRTADPWQKLHGALGKLKDARIRAIASQASWATYYAAVAAQSPRQELDLSLWGPALALARENKLPALIDPQGAQGVLDVTTEAEGEANLEVANLVAAHAHVEGVSAFVPRARP